MVVDIKQRTSQLVCDIKTTTFYRNCTNEEMVLIGLELGSN